MSKIATSLEQAKILNTVKFIGDPCEVNKTHSLVKYKSTLECVDCVRARGARKRARINQDNIADSRDDAITTGRVFFRGKRCHRAGHGNIKYKSSGRCIMCKWESDILVKKAIKPIIIESPITKDDERLAYCQPWR